MTQAAVLLGRLLFLWDSFYARARNAAEHAMNAVRGISYRWGRKEAQVPGYPVYREACVKRAIDDGVFTHTRLPEGFGVGLDERIVEYPWLFSRLDAKPGRLLDAGSVLNFDFLLRRPELASKQVFISTLAPEPQNFWWRKVSYTYEDLRHASFRDDYFDTIVCLSTIEHVDMDNTVYTRYGGNENAKGDTLVFLKELHRMLKPGGTLFLTFPYGASANLGWMRVFDAEATQTMIDAFQPTGARVVYYRYAETGWQRSSPREAADAGYNASKTANGKKLIAAEAVACLELVK